MLDHQPHPDHAAADALAAAVCHANFVRTTSLGKEEYNYDCPATLVVRYTFSVAVLDVNGVGYELASQPQPLRFHKRVRAVLTRMVVREDSPELFDLLREKNVRSLIACVQFLERSRFLLFCAFLRHATATCGKLLLLMMEIV